MTNTRQLKSRNQREGEMLVLWMRHNTIERNAPYLLHE